MSLKKQFFFSKEAFLDSSSRHRSSGPRLELIKYPIKKNYRDVYYSRCCSTLAYNFQKTSYTIKILFILRSLHETGFRQHMQGVRHLFYFIYPREFTVVNFTVPVLIQHVNQCGQLIIGHGHTNAF